uniref:ATP synthase F0 subunit 8 n=1 Tax=Thrips setosus TaxID=163897 RepID=A0A8K1RP66_9NEOP|nr:ATP synthase F0 subunit 8 [Thrips setosus]
MPQILPMSIYLVLIILIVSVIFLISLNETKWKNSKKWQKKSFKKKVNTFFLSLFIS